MKIPHTSVIFINNYTNPKLGKIIKKINNIIIGQEQQSYPKKVDIFLSCTVNNGSKHLTIFYKCLEQLFQLAWQEMFDILHLKISITEHFVLVLLMLLSPRHDFS